MLRWVAADVLEAVKGVRRVKGHKEMPTLVAALRARDQQLGLVANDAEKVASSSIEPPLSFNSERDNSDWTMTPSLLLNPHTERIARLAVCMSFGREAHRTAQIAAR